MDFSESVVNAQSGKVGPRLIITRIKYVFTTRRGGARTWKVGFTVDVVTQKAYGYRRGKIMSMLIAKREWGLTALVIHPTLKNAVQHWLNPLPILNLRSLPAISALFSRRATRALRYPAWLQFACCAWTLFEWFIWRSQKIATGDASREKKSQAFTCW